LAYRATFVGAFALSVLVLLAQRLLRSGLGRDVIERAIREIVAAGYLVRQQRPSRGRGTYPKVREKLLLPPCDRSACNTWRIVCRGWFDGTLSVKEMAAFLYLRAKRGATAKDLRDRFGWSPPTARKVLRALVELNLARAKGQRYLPSTAAAVWPTTSENFQGPKSEKSQGTVGLEREKVQGTYLSYGVKNNERASQLASLAGLSAATLAVANDEKQTATPGNPAAAFFAASSNGCAWEIQPVDGVASEKVAAVAALATDKELAAAIKAATGGRVADVVLSPPGLNAFRQLAGSLVATEITPAAALKRVLDAAHARLRGGGKLFASALNRQGVAA